MPDLALISGAITSLRMASDIAKGLVAIRDETLRSEKVIELQRIILSAQGDALSAQSDQLVLLQQIGDLEKEIDRLKRWEAEKQRYELKRYDPGIFLYILKNTEASGEPVHHICAKCYEDGKKSIIQRVSLMPGNYFCPSCTTQYHLLLRTALVGL